MPNYVVPKQVEFQGVRYDVDSSSKNILSIYKLLESDISDEERAVAFITKMFGVHAPIDQKLINKGLEIIRLGRSESELNEQVNDFDFFFDYSSVRMDIIREYGIDIDVVNVQWDWLMYAIENLSTESITNQKRMIRTVDLSKIKDKEQKKQYKKLKQMVKLPNENYESEKQQISEMEQLYEEYKKKMR